MKLQHYAHDYPDNLLFVLSFYFLVFIS